MFRSRSRKEGESTKDQEVGNLRRTVAGREAVKVLMETLFESDCNAFGRAPAFASDGTCRMKFDGADKFKWDDILSVAPKAIEWLSPATFCSNFAFAGFLIFVVVDFLNGMLYGDVKDVFFQLYIYICIYAYSYFV